MKQKNHSMEDCWDKFKRKPEAHVGPGLSILVPQILCIKAASAYASDLDTISKTSRDKPSLAAILSSCLRIKA